MHSRVRIIAASLSTLLVALVSVGYFTNLLTCTSSTKDPKAATAFIQVQPSEIIQEKFRSIGERPFVSALFGYRIATEEIQQVLFSYASGHGSGSGFMVAHSSGDTGFLVTNRHVVSGFDRPQVSFDGGNTVLRASVIYVDDGYDLAILELPSSIPGLKLAGAFKEAEDVFAHGYPGLNMKESYQVTRGSVSNRCLEEGKFKESDSKRCWIQHTAAIDPGSSGGPLVNGSNEVVGVNTAIREDRRSLFIAVPVEAMKEALKKAGEIRANRTSREGMLKDLKETCRRFVSELTSTNPNPAMLMAMLSDKNVAENGIGAFVEVLSEMPQVKFLFMNNPYSALQASIIKNLQEGFSFGIEEGKLCNDINTNDDVLKPYGSVRIKMKLKVGKTVELFWVYDGGWKLKDYNYQR